jgi:hypothetical protein
LLHALRQRVLGLDRIVDDDLVGAEAGDVAANGISRQLNHTACYAPRR